MSINVCDNSSKKWVHFIILTGMFIALFFNYRGFAEGHDWGDDFAGYVIQAQTLASGDFKALEYNMGRNDFQLNYPWGFPVLLKPVICYFEENIVFIKKYVYLFFIGALFFVYLLFRRDKTTALLVIWLLLASPYFWKFKNDIGSDLPNLMFVTAGLFLINQCIEHNTKWLNRYFDLILLGFCLFMAYICRTQSFILIITFVILYGYKQWRNLRTQQFWIGLFLPLGMFYLLLWILKLCIPIESIAYDAAYENTPWLSTLWYNLGYYAKVWEELIIHIPVLEEALDVLVVLGACLTILGLISKWREQLTLIVFICLTFGLILLTPFYQGLRYLMPLLPLLIYFLVEGICFVVVRCIKQNIKIAYLLPLGFASFSLTGLYKLQNELAILPVREGPYTSDAKAMFSFLRKNNPDTCRVGFWKPRAMLLYSGLNAKIPKDKAECIQHGLKYYVWYKYAYTDQIPADTLVANADFFRPVYANASFSVFTLMYNKSFTRNEVDAELIEKLGNSVKRLDYRYFSVANRSNENENVPLWSADLVFSDEFSLPVGNYICELTLSGTPADKKWPICKVSIGNSVLGGVVCATEKKKYYLRYENKYVNPQRLKLTLENDLQKANEDRNAFFYELNIYETPTGTKKAP